MELIRTAAQATARFDEARARGEAVGLVPTMGAFHEGHRSLMQRARAECDLVVVYLFVNPLQFGESADFDRYPREESADAAIAESEEVDVLFPPTVEEMYPHGYPPPDEEQLDAGRIGDALEGAMRPGHFKGVLTVVDRLLSIAGACDAYFGEKDAQQLFLIRQMAAERHPATTILPCATVREPDGLALSSRNRFLEPPEREAATCLVRALQSAARAHLGGERDTLRLRAEMARTIGAEELARIDYAAIVDEATFEDIDHVDRPARALVAARIGSVRLIDNLKLAGG